MYNPVKGDDGDENTMRKWVHHSWEMHLCVGKP